MLAPPPLSHCAPSRRLRPPPPRAQWCGHCKRLAPTWEELGEAFTEEGAINIGRVDCTVHRDTCTNNGIHGYPTLLAFKSGSKEGIKYAGSRDLSALKDL